MSVAELEMSDGFAGLIGTPALEQMKTTIDYREGRVRLEHKPRRMTP